MPGISVAPSASITSHPSRGRGSPGPAPGLMRLPCPRTSPGSRSVPVPSKIIVLVKSVLAIDSSWNARCFHRLLYRFADRPDPKGDPGPQAGGHGVIRDIAVLAGSITLGGLDQCRRVILSQAGE